MDSSPDQLSSTKLQQQTNYFDGKVQKITDETNDDSNSNSWQSQPSKNRMREFSSSENSSQDRNKQPIIQLRNRFHILPDESSESSSAETQPKPPPIFIQGVTNYIDMIKQVSTYIDKTKFVGRTQHNNVAKIKVSDSGSYRTLVKKLKEKNKNKHLSVGTRHLHHSIPENEINRKFSGQKRKKY